MSKWVVHWKGGPDEWPFEITVIRATNIHGQKSFGWFGDDKRLISQSGGPCRDTVSESAWNGLLVVAEFEAERLNKKKSGRTV